MSDIMTPIPFGKMMNWILEEHKKGAIFGIRRPFVADQSKKYEIFGRTLETPFGPAAGPHTQLTQNIVAAYVAGSRFFELKTVQKLDGEDLPVAKPCIKADDECYNCEWSTELYVPQAYDEYVKAWFACKVLAKEYGLGSMDGFQFNMSVGYDLEGIKLEKVDRFIEGMKDASAASIFNECRQWLLDNLDRFENLTKEDVESISPEICNCATLSTLHGCPPQEIERIASYLLTEKKVHTFIKCNPTLLGYEYARKLMDDMGYDYVAFGDFHFRDDLQYTDAVPMLQRLQKLADEKGLEFGVKITNTFPVDVKQNELPSEEMYMSGKSLYALSMSVAQKLENGELICRKMQLGDYDASGRRGVVETEEIVKIAADTVIAAVGEKVPGAFYEANGIAVDEKKRPVVDHNTLETSVKGVYVAGDGLFGPATVVEGIRDGKKAAEAIVGRDLSEDIFKMADAETVYGRKGKLSEENEESDSRRCLSCNSICENCVEVCPNRANVTLTVPGMDKHQVIHVDYMCNECGNCRSFCPWDSAPYLDKFTLFANEADMENSKNQGFTVLDAAAGTCKVRLAGNVIDYTVGTANENVPDGIQKIIKTVIDDYSYLLIG